MAVTRGAVTLSDLLAGMEANSAKGNNQAEKLSNFKESYAAHRQEVINNVENRESANASPLPAVEQNNEIQSPTPDTSTKEKPEAKKEPSYVTNNILFEQWKEGFDRQQEEKNAEKREELQKKLDELNQNAAYISTTAASDEYEQERKDILNQLHALDEAAGREDRSYDGRERAGAFFGSWGKGTGASYTNAAANLIDVGNEVGANAKGAERELADLEAQLARAQTAYQEAVREYGEVGATLERNLLADAQQKYDAKKALYATTEGRDRAAYEKTKATAANMYDVADMLLTQSEQDMQKAKYGTSAVGSFALDAAKTGLDIGLDTAISALGVPGLANMAARVYGSETQQARLQGDDAQTAAAKGLKSALIEVVTEKIAGPFEKAYGKTALSSSINKAVDKLNASGLLKWAVDTAGEGFEEGMSDVLNTVADHMMGWDSGENSVLGDIAANKDEIVYDMLLGAFVGAFGATGNAIGAKANTTPTAQAQPQVEQTAPVQTAPTQAETSQQAAPAVQATQTNPVDASQGAKDNLTPPTAQNVEQGDSGALNNAVNYNGRETAAEFPTLAQKNTTSTQETESTAINDDPSTHTAEELKRIEEYKAAVDDNLVNYIEAVRNNPGARIGRYSLKPVSDRAANDIKALTGIDVSGNKTVLESRMVGHILKEHGENGRKNQTMRDVNDIARLQYVIDTYDDVSHGGASSAYVTTKPNGKHGEAQTVVFSKAVDGKYYVVEAVPDTKKKTLYIVSAYISDNKTADLPSVNAEASRVTSETAATESTKISIPTDTQNVNENIKNADALAALADKVSQNTDDAMSAEDVEISQGWASEPSAEDALRLKREGASGVEIYDKTGLFIDVDGNVRMPGTGDVVARETGTKEVQNVAHADRNLFTKGERISVNEKLGEKGTNTHVRQSDELTVNEARRLIKDRGAEYETARLLSTEVDGSDKKGGFGNLEVCELELLLRDKVQEARKYMLTSPAKLRSSEFAEIISQLSDIEDKIQEIKTDAAQKLRQVGGAITPTEAITARAMKTFLNNGDGNINPKSKSAKRLRDIMGHLESIDAISDGDIGAMVSEIGKLSEQRGTNKVLGGKGQKAIDTLLDYRANQDGGFEWLKTLAYAQTDALITDAHSGFRGSPLECLKTLRVSNLLSNPSTWLNNFGNNTAALFWNARGQNAGRWADIGLSKFTGTQTLAKDSSFTPSKAQADAITRAAAEATLNVLFDVNVDGTLPDSGKGRTKYESTGANYFKMSGGTIERILAQYEMLIRETLVMPDEVAKAQIKTGLDANRTQAVEDGKINQKAWAELMGDSTHEARYRTLQSDTEMTWAVQQFKNFLNKAHISDSKGGSIGSGDMVAVFAKAPANVVTHKIQNSPIGWGMSFIQYANAVKSAKSGKLSATEQAKVSRAVGRTLNGFTMTALSAICAGLGIVKRFDDDDADKAAIDKSRGMSGLQWNISALFRFLTGRGFGGEWHDDDICIGGDWLEILSLPSALGVEMYQDFVDGASWTELPGLALAFTAENVKETLFSLPGLSTLENIYNNINYGNSGWESVLTSAADVLGSMLVPNAAYQFAAGADNTVRDIYNTDSAWETAANILKQREYFLRKTIAPKVNALGEDQKHGDSTVMGILNKVLLPGDVRQYMHGEYEDVIDMLINAGENVRYPSKSAPDTITVGEGKDKQDFVLTADEKRQYLKISGATTKELVSGMSGYDFYDTLDASTKNDIVSELTSYAKSAAKQAIIEGRLGDNADLLDTGAASWMNNVPEETAGKYIFAKNTIKQMYDDGKLTDYAGMDDYLGNRLIGYMQLGNAGREALNNAFPRIDDMYTAYRAGISSKQWSETYEKYKEISNSPKEDYGTTDKTTDFSAWVDSRSSLSSQQKKLLKEQFKFYSHIQGEASLYNKLTGVGYEPKEANDLYWRLDGMSTDGNNNVSQKEAYARLSCMDDISDGEKNVLWSVINTGWKTSYTEYKKKHS